jgi:leucyl-tRNA---protein transferase
MSQPTFSHFPAIPLPQLQPPPELVTLEPTPCTYLPGRISRVRAFLAGSLHPDAYHALMDAGFRRSGRILYQPVCPTCRACVGIRVPVDRFRPSRSQRRCSRKNGDLLVSVESPQPTAEKHALYAAYQTQWHAGQQSADFASFAAFLYSSPVDTREFLYRTSDGRLLGVGICDLSAASLSSVYFYFDTAAAGRSLGTFSALYEIAYARTHDIPYWYAGFHVAGCPSMSYKSRFRPHELLGTDGTWRASNSLPP